MILETEGVEPRCEKRLGGGGGAMGGMLLSAKFLNS